MKGSCIQYKLTANWGANKAYSDECISFAAELGNDADHGAYTILANESRACTEQKFIDGNTTGAMVEIAWKACGDGVFDSF